MVSNQSRILAPRRAGLTRSGKIPWRGHCKTVNLVNSVNLARSFFLVPRNVALEVAALPVCHGWPGCPYLVPLPKAPPRPLPRPTLPPGGSASKGRGGGFGERAYEFWDRHLYRGHSEEFSFHACQLVQLSSILDNFRGGCCTDCWLHFFVRSKFAVRAACTIGTAYRPLPAQFTFLHITIERRFP